MPLIEGPGSFEVKRKREIENCVTGSWSAKTLGERRQVNPKPRSSYMSVSSRYLVKKFLAILASRENEEIYSICGIFIDIRIQYKSFHQRSQVSNIND